MRHLAFILAILLLLPAGASAQRLGRRAFGGGVMPAQVWRVPTLTFEQRTRLRDVQESLVREVGGGRANRAELRDRFARTQSEVRRIVGDEQFERARSMPRGQLGFEELLYYPALALPDLAVDRRAKLTAAFEAVRSGAPADPEPFFGRGDRDDPERQRAREEQRVRGRIFFEALEALLTPDQMTKVAEFVPERARRGAMRPQNVARLGSLTMEQEARARAIFAAFDDETAADRARREAMAKELQDPATTDAKRRALRDERREVERRIDARAEAAYEQLGKVLTAEQMRELETSLPGPRRPVLFTPENVASLSLSAEQQRRVREAMQSFRRDTVTARDELRDLRGEVKGDLTSMEMAPVRDKLRRAADVVDAGRDKVVGVLVATLTAEQFGQLARRALEEQNRERQRPGRPGRPGLPSTPADKPATQSIKPG